MTDRVYSQQGEGKMRETREQQREKRIKREMETCVHFTGIQQKKCQAGIVYRDLVGGPDFGWACKIPCTMAYPDEKDRVECASRQTPTYEQAEKEVDKSEARMKVTLRVIRETHEDAKKNGLGIGHGGSGKLPCTSCGEGSIHYSVASVNGHIHGRCSKEGCVQWIVADRVSLETELEKPASAKEPAK